VVFNPHLTHTQGTLPPIAINSIYHLEKPIEMKKILILFLILVSTQVFARIGENRDFWIISQSDFNKRISKGRDVTLRRYIVVPDFDRNFKEILETTDKQKGIDKYIENQNNRLEKNELIKGLYYFSRKQYSNALIHFEKINNDEYAFLKYLLIADCKYELNYGSKDAKNSIELYQPAMDKSNNELEKLIINNRVKYIRYK